MFRMGDKGFTYWIDGSTNDLKAVRARYDMFDIPEEIDSFTFAGGGTSFSTDRIFSLTLGGILEYLKDTVQKIRGTKLDMNYFLRYQDKQGTMLEAHIMLAEPWH